MQKIEWNENWKVWKESNAFNLVFSIPADAKTVTLPYDALFFQKQNPDSVNEGKTGFMDGGTYNYYKEEFFPDTDRGKEILLLVEGCAVKTWVFVNGSLAGECDYPYMEFYVNLSPLAVLRGHQPDPHRRQLPGSEQPFLCGRRHFPECVPAVRRSRILSARRHAPHHAGAVRS